MGGLLQDLRYAVRSLRRSPAFSATAVLTLALGIGATTAVFSVVNAVLLRALPYEDAGRLVRIDGRGTRAGAEAGPLSAGDYVDLASRQRAFTGLGAFRLGVPARTLTGSGEPQTVGGGEVAASMFRLLGVRPHVGRTFAPGDDEPGAEPVVLLGYELWSRAFGADPAVVGRTVVLDDTTRTVVGVLPPGAGVPELEADLWLPLALEPVLRDPDRVRRRGWLGAIGRLRPGVTFEQARDEVVRIGRALELEHPSSNEGRGLFALTLRDALAGHVRPTVLALLAASGLVLLVACGNLAGAFLARLLARSREQAVRSALGAGRGRLARHAALETLVLTAAGGALGLLAVGVGLPALLAAGPPHETWLVDPDLDLRVLAFTAATTGGAALLLGVVPALLGARIDLRRVLVGGDRGSTAADRNGVRTALLAAQFGLAVVLCIGAGLTVKSLAALHDVELGFGTSRVLAFEMAPTGRRYERPDDHVRLVDALLERLRAVPGVVEAAAASTLPLVSPDRAGIVVEGRVPEREGIEFVDVATVSDGYFAAMRVPLRRGRVFGAGDRAGSTPVTVVSRRLAEAYWPGADPLGRRVRLGPDPNAPWHEVVGVVGDVRQEGVDRPPQPTAYLAARQASFSPVAVVVRTTDDPLALAGPAREALRSVDPLLPLYGVRTLERIVEADLADRRFLVLLLGIFAALALGLASVGVYGLSAYAVSTRTREFGVRMALGSTRGGVLGLVLRQGLGTALAGLALGLAAVAMLAPILRRFLFDVRPLDPQVLAGASAVLLTSALVAALDPARRATRVDPASALRSE